MDTKIITLPEEFGSHVYKVRSFCPRNIKNMITNAAKDKDIVKSQDILLTKSVIDPLLTESFLNSEDCDGAEMDYLAIYLMDMYHMDITEDKIEELKKKTKIK